MNVSRRIAFALAIVGFVVLVVAAGRRLWSGSASSPPEAAMSLPADPEPGPRTPDPEGTPDPSPEGQLVAAARDGNADRIRELLAQGVSPDARNVDGRGALQRAAQRGRLEAVRVLLEAGGGLDAPDEHGMTPLMTAAFGGSLAVGLHLMEVGADLNAQHEPYQVTALEQAFGGWLAYNNMKEVPLAGDRRQLIEAMFRAGADPNLGGPFGSAIRYLLNLREDEAMVRLFFEHGARVEEDRQVWQLEELPGPVGDLMRKAVQEAKQRTGAS